MKKNLKTNEIQLKTVLKRTDFWIGLATVAVIGIVGINFLVKALPKTKQGIFTTNMRPKEITSPIPSSHPISVTGSVRAKSVITNMKISVTPTPAKLAQIKKLADTGKFSIEVQPGDSFWKLAQTYCGSGEYAEKIINDNQYMNFALNIGDQLIINCN